VSKHCSLSKLVSDTFATGLLKLDIAQGEWRLSQHEIDSAVTDLPGKEKTAILKETLLETHQD